MKTFEPTSSRMVVITGGIATGLGAGFMGGIWTPGGILVAAARMRQFEFSGGFCDHCRTGANPNLRPDRTNYPWKEQSRQDANSAHLPEGGYHVAATWKSLSVFTTVTHWAGCLLASAVVLLFVVFAIGKGLPPLAAMNASFAAVGVMLIGFVLVWWKDWLGGVISLVGLALVSSDRDRGEWPAVRRVVSAVCRPRRVSAAGRDQPAASLRSAPQ